MSGQPEATRVHHTSLLVTLWRIAVPAASGLGLAVACGLLAGVL